MSTISVTNLTFCYEGSYHPVFENLSLSLDTSWHLGLTGRNGRGKTTLIRLLLGSQNHPFGLHAASGSVHAPLPLSYFPAPISCPDQPALEAAQSLCPQCPEWKLLRELSLLEFPEDALWRPYSQLSGGEQTKLQLAALFVQEGGFPLLDEPTNHLDAHSRQLVANYLRRQSGFLLISHDRAFLDGCVDHILALNRTGPELRRGDFSGWYADYLSRTQSQREQNTRLRREISRLEQSARRTADWSDRVEASKIGQGVYDRGAVGHKAAKMMKRSKAIQARQLQAAEQKKKLLHDVENIGELRLAPLSHFSSRLIQARDLSICLDSQPLFAPVTFSLEQGERLCLSGNNGCGKTSLLRLICGEALPHTGLLETASGLRLSLVEQDTSRLCGSLADYLERCGADLTLCLSILRNLGFERSQFELPMEQYSQGQKKKVLIARSLCQQAHLYLWDEPLNYLDLFSRIQLEQLLTASPVTLLFVEHDQQFCKAVATNTVHLHRL